jgi:hypothetical protein
LIEDVLYASFGEGIVEPGDASQNLGWFCGSYANPEQV